MENLNEIINEEISKLILCETHNIPKSEWELISSNNYTGTAGGQMGTASHEYVAGKVNLYKYNNFGIEEYVPRKDLKQSQRVVYDVFDWNRYNKHSPNYSYLATQMYDTIDWDIVYKKQQELHQKELREIESANLSNAIEIMKKNEKGFKFFMNSYQQDGYSKPIAFLLTVKDYYSNYPSLFDINVMAKIMIKYGYDFKSIKEIGDFMYHTNPPKI